MIDLERRLLDAEKIAAACAEVALSHFHTREELAVDYKGPRDFVSNADRQVEMKAIELLAELYPNEPLIGEEYGGEAAGDHWIIDPIDGTTNFLNGLPLWAVSLAFIQNHEPVVGVIALPALGNAVSAAKSSGLRLGNDSPRGFVSQDCALVGVGRNDRWCATERFQFEQDLEAAGTSIVCLGSCATSLAMVASGQLRGYFERSVKPWDVAAGIILCSEAGITIDARYYDGCVDISAGQIER